MRAHTDTEVSIRLDCASYRSVRTTCLTCCSDDANLSLRLISLLYRSVDKEGGEQSWQPNYSAAATGVRASMVRHGSQSAYAEGQGSRFNNQGSNTQSVTELILLLCGGWMDNDPIYYPRS
jgi:hypothetical protein